ncbi:uncharacterized protein CLIB1423_16S00452 [[Candida] railenensis]|uniref:Uncharacterized protein n=1 Tax=[Candida] railenensis TaxID=45579 RepID=A0A9P0QTA8_9ASCO|nr:uncharacterized protein CLIB1423_16S00452 [[Candida] railenensis]
MSFGRKLKSSKEDNDPFISINRDRPLRIALLGGRKSGKSSIASRLSSDVTSDTYYPTHKTNALLFQFFPHHLDSRAFLDPTEIHLEQYTRNRVQANESKVDEDIILNSVLRDVGKSRTLSKKVGASTRNNDSGEGDWEIKSKTEFYKCLRKQGDQEKGPPQISPILVELIDTPPFNPDQVVPFLENSLYMKLDPQILKNLANEPSKPVSTNPLLVASGAGEMNGYVDGYFFVYSAIPTYNPPSYNESVSKKAEDEPNMPQKSSSNTNSIADMLEVSPGDSTFKLLLTIKDALGEAWKEYNSYTANWKRGAESDIFSFKGAMKNMWGKSRPESNLREVYTSEPNNSKTFLESPPIWLICTHVDSELASPQLIENGKKLAKLWNSGFLAVDCTDEEGNVEQALSLLIREIVERKQ